MSIKKTIDTEKRAAEDSFYEFIKQAWHVVEPGIPFVDGWHIKAIAEHLEAVANGQIRRLLINIPFRMSKSTIVSVMFPVWEWIESPHQKYLCASYSSVLSTRDALKSRRLIQSPWFQERWGGRFNLSGDQNIKSRYENDHTGYRIATSVGGSATGDGGSRLILDDPHNAQEAQSDVIRESTIEWMASVWSSRLNNAKTDANIVVMHRLHEKDISGYILEELGGWEHILIPMEYDRVKRRTVLGAYDPRTEEGELISPDRFGPSEVATLKTMLGVYGSSGQLQQGPTPTDRGEDR